jgi:hypothetical protein
MKSIRTHLNYANVAATLALLFAMSGGAFAAGHYLINSTTQISPKVLKQLRGRAVRQSPLAALASGKSESGDYGIRTTNAGSSGFIGQSVSFPVPLAARISEKHVEWIDENHKAGPHCAGVGHASPGYLCLYEQESVDIAAAPTPIISEYEDLGPHDGSGNFGFTIAVPVSGAEPLEYGTFTVTAP